MWKALMSEEEEEEEEENNNNNNMHRPESVLENETHKIL